MTPEQRDSLVSAVAEISNALDQIKSQLEYIQDEILVR